MGMLTAAIAILFFLLLVCNSMRETADMCGYQLYQGDYEEIFPLDTIATFGASSIDTLTG